MDPNADPDRLRISRLVRGRIGDMYKILAEQGPGMRLQKAANARLAYRIAAQAFLQPLCRAPVIRGY